jgi:lysophospholipase L1-like esterase
VRRRTRRALLGVAAVPAVAVAVLGIEVQLARMGPGLPDDTPLDHDGRLGGPGPSLRTVWLGDSTAAGVGATHPDRALPRQVAARLGRPVDVTSLAVSGDRIADVLADQVGALAALRPDVVLVSIGANDVVHLTRRDDFRADYERLIATVPDGALLVVLGVPDMGAPPRLAHPLRALAGWRGRQLAEVSEAVSGDAQAVYVDIAGETGPAMRADTGRFFAADRYHPSDAGYELWADAVLAQLAPALTALEASQRNEEEVALADR